MQRLIISEEMMAASTKANYPLHKNGIIETAASKSCKGMPTYKQTKEQESIKRDGYCIYISDDICDIIQRNFSADKIREKKNTRVQNLLIEELWFSVISMNYERSNVHNILV